MKNFLKNYGLLSGMIVLFVAVFAIGGVYSRFMTEQIEVRQSSNANAEFLTMIPGATKVVSFATDSVVSTYNLYDGRGTFEPMIEAAYKVYNGTTEIGVIYVVHSYGKLDELIIAYAILLETDSVVAVKVINNQETPSYFARLDAAFLAQFGLKSFDDLALSVDAAAGSTYSSKGFEMGMLYAREQYAKDYGFVIPSIVMTLNSLTYNLNPANFANYPFIADVTYGDLNTNIVVYLTADFSYGALKTGVTEPAADVQSAIKTLSAASNAVSTSVKLVSYISGTRELIISSQGYGTQPIEIKIYLNIALDGIDSFEIDSNETYFEEDESLFELGVETFFLNQYIANGPDNIDAISGASVTSGAMQKLIDLLDLFVASIGGGA